MTKIVHRLVIFKFLNTRSYLNGVFCLQNGSGDLSECTSSIGSPNKAPGAHLSRSEFNVQQFQIAHEDTIQAVIFLF